MSKRVFSNGSVSYSTPTALNALVTSGQALGIVCQAATQEADILELVVQGTATASAVFGGVLARVSTASASQTALATPAQDGFQDPNASALGTSVKTYTAATTMPTPANTTTNVAFPMVINAFGGLYRENFAPTQQYSIFGTATPFAESVLFNCTSWGGVSASVSAAMMYEPH